MGMSKLKMGRSKLKMDNDFCKILWPMKTLMKYMGQRRHQCNKAPQ